MKIVCNVCVGNRMQPLQGHKRRHVKSTLALCKHPNKKEYFLIWFSSQNKSGVKYGLLGNVVQILTRFLEEGKATIQLKEPSIDLYIQSEVVQLKSFLHLIKAALLNKLEDKPGACSSMSVQGVKTKDLVQSKLVITKRSDYPVKGFPRTLEVLFINDIRRCGFDMGILRLSKLKILNLSNNLIEFLPQEVSNLTSLRELNLSHNELGKAPPKQWKWLQGPLAQNLILLDVSHNNLKFLPEQIGRFHKLNTLNLNDNQLQNLPASLGNLRLLKIFSLANNQITFLPGSIKKWCLQSIDLSNNRFPVYGNNIPAAIFPKPPPVCSLKEIAAKKVLWARLLYTPATLPLTLIDFLDQAKFCVCGKACFNVFIRHSTNLMLSDISESITANAEMAFVPVDCHFCSVRCFGSSFYTRNRNRVI